MQKPMSVEWILVKAGGGKDVEKLISGGCHLGTQGMEYFWTILYNSRGEKYRTFFSKFAPPTFFDAFQCN